MVDRRTQLSDEDELQHLHERLHRHFSDLGEQRRERGVPVFALEHGLSGPEILLLKQEVSASLATGRVDRQFWLPTVVYAAEIGYGYSGDEYWPTFEGLTPGWAKHGERSDIRERFREFSEQFGGAEPEGRWSRHFTIICWPITHAILPVDLQRHLAHLLHDFRRALTSENLADPDLLGAQLAARSWQASSRFQTFAQDASLLGRLAFALLARDEEPSPYLLGSTLERIVSDLSAEGQAGEWLRGAKSTAEYVRTRGFRSGAAEGGTGGSEADLPPAADPDLWLRRGPDGWGAYLELPNFSVLAERLPELTEELTRLRARVEGVEGAPLARSRLFFSGQILPLGKWPSGSTALVQLEGGSDSVNALLGQQCGLTPGPRWLFKIRDAGSAKEVRGNHVRPGNEYILISSERLPSGLPSWIAPTATTTDGVHAYRLRTPETLDEAGLSALRDCGVGARTDVAIHPAGVVPSSWDGEGRAEWLAGESPVLAISTTRATRRSIWALDQTSQIIEWPPDQDRVFVRFQDLDSGSHLLEVTLMGENESVAEGSFEIGVRDPEARPSSGTLREALLILPTPVNPTLTELWGGSADVEIRGPSGLEIEIDALLRNRSGALLARKQHQVTLPVSAHRWADLLDQLFRQDKAVQDVYDDAELCILRASYPGLGVVTLRSERDFAPLRWAGGRDREGPFLRLINNTENSRPDVDYFEFQRPDSARKIEIDIESRVRLKAGGLFRARAGSAAETAAILSPNVRRLEEIGVDPTVSARGRGTPDLLKLFSLAELWGSASGSADPVGATGRIKALRAITTRLAVLVCGQDWALIEKRVAAEQEIATDELLVGLGRSRYQLDLGRALSDQVDAFAEASLPERVRLLAQTLIRHAWKAGVRGDGIELAEFLLRLASEPGTLRDWSGPELESNTKLVLGSPVLLRAARFVVIVVDRMEGSSASSAYAGWRWE